ncbi:hypothetical protein Goshw_030023 [Gossypium schwendimanii]|uniref:MULE transposase domain-containing protein n=1 Tax=Gossypium schwendimanii TaxID=34291 RepID=A0A7J9MR78_GOSSC|nr:hypothetical protein [Gossypium schwendimanii]
MLFPNAKTRHCVRHLHANFKASTPRDFEDVMVELKNTNEHASDWLKGKNLAHCSLRSKFHNHLCYLLVGDIGSKREAHSDHDGNN